MGSEVPKKTLDLENLLNAFELFVAREFDVFMEDPTIIRLDGAYKVIIENKDDKPDHNWVHAPCQSNTFGGGKRPFGPLLSF